MPVLDGDFEAFVTNLGKYNEGMLVGEWVKLPTTEESAGNSLPMRPSGSWTRRIARSCFFSGGGLLR